MRELPNDVNMNKVEVVATFDPGVECRRLEVPGRLVLRVPIGNETPLHRGDLPGRAGAGLSVGTTPPEHGKKLFRCLVMAGVRCSQW